MGLFDRIKKSLFGKKDEDEEEKKEEQPKQEEEEKQEQERERRNQEINQKISELEQMAISDVLQGNKENINISINILNERGKTVFTR